MKKHFVPHTIVTADLDLPSVTLKIKVNEAKKLSSSDTSSMRNSKKESSSTSVVPEIDEETKGNKVYVYMQLTNIKNLTQKENQVDLTLQMGSVIVPKLSYDCDSCNLSKLMENKCNITYSFPVYQDSIVSLNKVSDEPVLIVLKEIIKHKRINSENKEEIYEEVRPIGQGYIDILGFFQTKRFAASVDTYIYPIDKLEKVQNFTVVASFQIYTLLPPLKNLEYSNVLFISFESLYNCTDDFMNESSDLMVDIVIRPNSSNTHGKENDLKICSFGGFKKSIIAEQNPNFIWESSRSVENLTGTNFGLYAESKVHVYKLFHRLLRPEGKPLNFSQIDVNTDEVLVCNSIHRFVLTPELQRVLEETFIYRLQELVVRIYKKDAPQDILLEGLLEPSVFLYPFVNAVRFAVVFQPLNKSIPPKKRKSKKGSEASGDFLRPPVFGIISMCFLTPITEAGFTVSIQKQYKSQEKVKSCKTYPQDVQKPSTSMLKGRAYDSFDEWVDEIIDYIVKNNIREVADAKNFFCCQSENAGNRILALIALDFNKRFPTANNIEFRNLMTTVYKELENRVHKAINDCGEKDLKDCCKSYNNADRIIKLMGFFKLSKELNDELTMKIMRNELKDYPKSPELAFYMFLHNMETGNYEEAEEYTAKPLRERNLEGEYFTRILNIYIVYIRNLKHEEIFNEAFERLLSDITNMLKGYQNDINLWTLLYCMYKSCKYLPGMEFARWNSEDIQSQRRTLPENTPRPLWKFYLNYHIVFKSNKANEFYETVKMFLSIGAYTFAEIVFDEIANECKDIDRYLIKKTLQVLRKDVPPNTNANEFADAEQSELILNNVNGHLLYASGDIDLAMQYYEKTINLIDTEEEIEPYELTLRRYATYMMLQEKYSEALQPLNVLDKSYSSVGTIMIMGKVYYKLGSLREALECFKKATNFDLFIPDVWAYLALIHLKLGENFQALECWKYAKRIASVEISQEIIDDLNAIDIDEIDLYVDRPY